ncbi:multicopper oxidase domain-containing protein [Streptomyces sp. NPDC001492]
MDGVLGDVQLVNGARWPGAEISATRHRSRLLNASTPRRYHLVLRREDGGTLPFTQIGGDGGLPAAPQRLDGISMAPAERFDVVVDFTDGPVGSHVTLVNTLADSRMHQVMRFHIARKERMQERWRFISDFHHPLHLHLAHFQVLSRGGRASEPTDAGWKDTVDVRPSTRTWP